jgi:hypothetical protein
MLPATTAELIELKPSRIIATVLLGKVVSLFTVGTSQCNQCPNRFFSHFINPALSQPSRDYQESQERGPA